jgi:hypothetical protein
MLPGANDYTLSRNYMNVIRNTRFMHVRFEVLTSVTTYLVGCGAVCSGKSLPPFRRTNCFHFMDRSLSLANKQTLWLVLATCLFAFSGYSSNLKMEVALSS